jgi:hypothetical protein
MIDSQLSEAYCWPLACVSVAVEWVVANAKDQILSYFLDMFRPLLLYNLLCLIYLFMGFSSYLCFSLSLPVCLFHL